MLSLDVIQDFWSVMMIGEGFWAFSGMMFGCSVAAGSVVVGIGEVEGSCTSSFTSTTVFSRVMLNFAVDVGFWISGLATTFFRLF